MADAAQRPEFGEADYGRLSPTEDLDFKHHPEREYENHLIPQNGAALSLEQAAAYLGLSFEEVMDGCDERWIPHRHYRYSTIFIRKELDRWLWELRDGVSLRDAIPELNREHNDMKSGVSANEAQGAAIAASFRASGAKQEAIRLAQVHKELCDKKAAESGASPDADDSVADAEED